MAKQASVTLDSVARRAGVSISTASRALSGRGDLRAQTRDRVRNAAEELNYTLRQATLTSGVQFVELVLGSEENQWTAAVVSGARRRASTLGWDLLLTLERDEPSEDWPARVIRRRPVGVVLCVIRPTRRQLQEVASARVPIVLLDPLSDPNGEVASVGTTDWRGGYAAGAHLVATGLRRFAIITGAPRYRFGRAREDGFRAAIRELAGSIEVPRLHSGWVNADVSSDFGRLMATGAGPIGVFACNDEMAFAVYRESAALGLRIPQDVSVIGFNDEPRSAAATPGLTSVRQPIEQIASRAIELVQDLRQTRQTRHERLELPTRLLVRGSTLPLRQG